MKYKSLAWVVCLLAVHAWVRADASLHLTARSRSEVTPHSGRFEVIEKPVEWDPKQTALIICDLWDHHWCGEAEKGVAAMAPRIDALAKRLRSAGGLIVHAPSDTMAFYKDTPQRKLAQDAPEAGAPAGVQFHWNFCDPAAEPPLPIDDSDGGCASASPPKGGPYPWTREIAAVEVRDGDAVSDQGREIYNLFVQKGIKNLLFCGVHANMCVLGRSFGIRQMRKLGFDTLLVRDLTDTMYNPHSYPYVPHDRGTDLVVAHVEKYWCPSISSADVLGDAKPARLVFAIAEDEYGAAETLPAFADAELKPDGVECVFLKGTSKTDLPGLGALASADGLVMFMRRRELPPAEMDAFRAYFEAGKPVVALRTSCHAFQNDLQFDERVLGGHYGNHYAPTGRTTVRIAGSATDSPLLRGVSKEWTTGASLYRMLPLLPTCEPLLNGKWEGEPQQPVAWTTLHQGGRVFFTSLGSRDDFADPNFRRLLHNAILWSLDKPVR